MGLSSGQATQTGSALVSVDTDAPAEPNSYYILHSGTTATILHKGGDIVPKCNPTCGTTTTIDRIGWGGPSTSTTIAFELRIHEGILNDSGLYIRLNTGALALLGQRHVTESPWTGYYYTAFVEPAANNSRRVLFGSFVATDTFNPPTTALAVMDTNSSGAVTSHTGLARVGAASITDVNILVTDVNINAGQFDLNNLGQILYSEQSDTWKVLLRDGSTTTVVAEEGDSVLGESYADFKYARVALNNSGGRAFIAKLTPSDRRTLVVNGLPWITTGDSMPGGLSAYTLTNLGAQGSYPDHLYLSDEGKPFWYAKFNDPNPATNEALMYGNKPIIRKGVTQDDTGRVIKDFGQKFSVNVRSLSDNGKWLLFTARVYGTFESENFEALFLYKLPDHTLPGGPP